MDPVIEWLNAQVNRDELLARKASGATVTGVPGSWSPATGGDEWATFQTDCDEDELLVALRPGLSQPPDVMSGLWGQIVCHRPEFEDDPTGGRPTHQLRHAAEHDPARVLREVAAARRRIERHTPQLMVGLESNEDDPSTFVPGCPTCQVTVVTEGDWPCVEVRDMLSIYSHRSGYRTEWQ